MKKFAPILLLALILILSACKAENEANQGYDSKEATIDLMDQDDSQKEADEEEGSIEKAEDSQTETPNESSMTDFDQTAMPQAGEQIVVMQTNKGTIKIRLFPEQAPKTVENFVGLAEKGYYDGIAFHRVIPNFMIQGGDPLGNGTGGESFWGGTFDNEVSMELTNMRGALAMANAGLDANGKGTNGSQFFINQVDNSYLNGYENGQLKDCSLPMTSCHAVFGQVFEGMEVVDAISEVETGAGDKPVEEVVMEKVTVENY